MNTTLPRCNSDCANPAELLNHDCYCTTLDRVQLDKFLRVDDLNQDVLATRPQLFSNTMAFISPAQLKQIRDCVESVNRVVNLPGYIQQVLAQAPALAQFNRGAHGVFMGYDFHLSAQGPQIIEINTNAGGCIFKRSFSQRTS